MDREIHNTTVLVIGMAPAETRSALAQAGLDVLTLDEIAPGARVKKFIAYAAGNIAGVFGEKADGQTLIVNAHVMLLDTAGAEGLLPALKHVDVSAVQTGKGGQAQRASGAALPGVYWMGPDFAPDAAVAYAQERLAHFIEAGKVMNRPRVMHIGGSYSLDILRPKLKVPHKLLIQNENGLITGTHITENDSQTMQNLSFDGQYLTWNAYSGTTSSELFTYRLEVFDDILLGATWRIDGSGPAAFKSPVVAERIHP